MGLNHTDGMDDRTAPQHGADYWERYGEPIDLDNPGDSRALVLGLLADEPQRILELGCSAGFMTAVMAERGHEVTAVEIDPVAAGLAASHAARILVGDLDRRDADGGQLLDELKSDSFDTLIAADVLEHLREPTECLRRALDLVTTDGTVVLSIPNVAHGDVRLALLEGRFDYRDHGLLDRTHVQLFTLASLVAMIREVGLAPVDWQRSTRAIGDTELDVDENLVEFGRRVLADDPEATTYQWIVTCRRAEAVGDSAVWPDVPESAAAVDGVLDALNAAVPHPGHSTSVALVPLPPPTPTASQRLRFLAAAGRERLAARLGR